MALPPSTIFQYDYDLIGSFQLVRIGRHPRLEWVVNRAVTYREGPFVVVQVEDRDEDETFETILFEGDLPSARYEGARILDPDTREPLATVVRKEDAEDYSALALDTALPVETQFLVEPLNEFGEVISLPASAMADEYYQIKSDTPEGVDLLQQLLVGIAVDYVKAVLPHLGVDKEDSEVLQAVVAAAQQGENIQAAIVRRLEHLVLAQPIPLDKV